MSHTGFGPLALIGLWIDKLTVAWHGVLITKDQDLENGRGSEIVLLFAYDYRLVIRLIHKPNRPSSGWELTTDKERGEVIIEIHSGDDSPAVSTNSEDIVAGHFNDAPIIVRYRLQRFVGRWAVDLTICAG